MEFKMPSGFTPVFQRAFPVYKRELLGYFRSPVAYVFIVIFLLSTTGATWYLGSFFQANEASLDNFFFFHPWLYLFLIPAVGMRLWSEERRSGTVEILLTLPLKLPEVVVAKFMAGWTFIAFSLFLTFPMIFTVYYLGEPDGGAIFTGYLGSFLMAGGYLAISSFTSALTKNQVISFILSFLVCFILVLLGWGVLAQSLESMFPLAFADFLTGFSFSTHFDALRRGVIDFRDIVFFLSLIGFMLFANVFVLDNTKSR